MDILDLVIHIVRKEHATDLLLRELLFLNIKHYLWNLKEYQAFAYDWICRSNPIHIRREILLYNRDLNATSEIVQIFNVAKISVGFRDAEGIVSGGK